MPVESITSSSQVVGVGARINAAAFRQRLADVGSPALPEAVTMYNAAVSLRVDPLWVLEVFGHESQHGTEGICHDYQTKNPGNVRTSVTHLGTIIDTSSGEFARFSTWTDGTLDMCQRLYEPTLPYWQHRAWTIETITPIWAPSSDKNDPDAYQRAIVAGMNARTTQMPADRYTQIGPYPVVWAPIPTYKYDASRAPKIIAAGIHDIEGSAAAALATFQSTSADDGEGSSHFIVDDVNKRYIQCVGLYSTSYGLGNYPYNQAAINIEQPGRSGLPYNPLVVSMTGTLVGFLSQQFAFPVVHRNRAEVVQMLPGLWAHEDIPDPNHPGQWGGSSHHNDPGPTYPWDTMIATALGQRGIVGTGDTGTFPETGFTLSGGIYQAHQVSGGVPVLGYPISREYDTLDTSGKPVRVQWLQRARAEWRAGSWPEHFDVQFGLLGAEFVNGKDVQFWLADIAAHPDAFVKEVTDDGSRK